MTAGLTAKGEMIPKTVEEYAYLHNLYEEKMLIMREEIARQHAKINKLKQQVSRLKKII